MVKLANVIWLRGLESVEPAMLNSGMVKTVAISENTGNTREFSEIETNEYLSYKGEGDQAARGKIQQGYSKTLTKYRMAENLGLTYEMKHENKYPEIVSTLFNGGRKGPNTLDLDLSMRLAFMTATSYTTADGRTIVTTVGDGFQLAYTVHTLKGSATLYRNRLANNPRVSKGALEGMERLITEETYNNLGESKVATFDILWTTDDPNTVNTVREYLQSTASVEGVNSGVKNVYQGKYKHVILPRVDMTSAGVKDSTKRYYWGIASSMLSSFYVGIWEPFHMVAPTVGGNGEDEQTDDLDFRLRMGYGLTIVGATWTKTSTGDGTA